MHISRTVVAAIVLLAFLLPSPEASSLLYPPGGEGSNCLECGTVTLMRSNGETIERPACLSAPSAAPLSGRSCRIEGEDCILSDLCQFA
jgi:hypothetical protein